ncbi:MAG TPA: hypothetical protein VNA20_15165 [Frankiaceae bacterium]|nr:hypothetical protein [Frankiaceae bacterium]
MTRKLSLRREALQELTTTDLTGVVGAAQTRYGICDTMYSCLTYESCACTPTIRPACW